MAETSRAPGILKPGPGGSRNQSAASTATAAEHRAVRGPPIMALRRTGNRSTSNGHASSVGGDHGWNAAITRPTRPTPAAYTNGQRRLRFRKVIATVVIGANSRAYRTGFRGK